MEILDAIAILVCFAAIFIYVNTFYLKLPSSVGHMIMALLLSLLVFIAGSFFPELHLAEHISRFDHEEILLEFVLSLMLFTQSLNVHFKKLGAQLKPVLALSIIGVLASTAIIGLGLLGLVSILSLPLTILECFIFGALISSTDPIAITDTIRRFRLTNRLETKISGEALLNGGVAAALALLLWRFDQNLTSEVANHSWITITTIAGREILGGLLLGALMGGLGYLLLDAIDNDIVEAEVLVTMALVLTGSFLAHYFLVSPAVVAVVTGLMLGNLGRSSIEESAIGAYVYKFWKLIEESLGVIVFVLIGFEMLLIPLSIELVAVGFLLVNIVLFARWLSVYLPIKLLSMQQTFENGTVAVLTWGALRGGLPVVLALSLQGIPGKAAIITITYVVVVITVLFQGFTLRPLLEHFKRRSIQRTINLKRAA